VPAASAAGGGTKPPDSGTRSAAQSPAINPVTSVVIAAMMASVEEVEVVVAHNERFTRVKWCVGEYTAHIVSPRT
jgi:hypothetical protein